MLHVQLDDCWDFEECYRIRRVITNTLFGVPLPTSSWGSHITFTSGKSVVLWMSVSKDKTSENHRQVRDVVGMKHNEVETFDKTTWTYDDNENEEFVAKKPFPFVELVGRQDGKELQGVSRVFFPVSLLPCRTYAINTKSLFMELNEA